jgi:NAD(P)-dependent dehydrogenase (short-subunit alcohol dehydrogenase family)
MSAFMDTSLQGQHAVVTGGGRGIGAAIADALAAHGATVTVMARTLSAVERTAQSLRERFETNARAIACDVSRPDDVKRAFAEAAGASGAVHILINNAGQAREAEPLEAVSLESWNRLIAVNLTGAMLCSQQVLPAMRAAASGRIVNVASTAGLRGYAGLAPYCASKHGVIGLTRALAAETAQSGITVNAVCPGYTEGTEMFTMAVENVMRTRSVSADEARALLAKHSPRRTPITPNEVAGTVLWLCSADASAITGQAVAIASGEVM